MPETKAGEAAAAAAAAATTAVTGGEAAKTAATTVEVAEKEGTAQTIRVPQPAVKPADGATAITDKLADGKAKGDGAPEKYEFKVPEGFSMDPGFVERTSAKAREKGLTQEEAQEFFDSRIETVEELKQTASEQRGVWLQQAQADKEIGGQRFVESCERASRAIKAFGSGSFVKALNTTGLGNHPEMIRFCAKIGAAMQDDKAVTGKTGRVASADPLRVMYPDMFKE